jgi:hypothetical protein
MLELVGPPVPIICFPNKEFVLNVVKTVLLAEMLPTAQNVLLTPSYTMEHATPHAENGTTQLSNQMFAIHAL